METSKVGRLYSSTRTGDWAMAPREGSLERTARRHIPSSRPEGMVKVPAAEPKRLVFTASFSTSWPAASSRRTVSGALAAAERRACSRTPRYATTFQSTFWFGR